MRKHVEKVASEGKLVELLRAVDDPDAIRKDAMGFANARRDHKRAVAEIDDLREKIADTTSITEGVGRQVAGVVAWMLGMAIAALLSMMIMFSGK